MRSPAIASPLRLNRVMTWCVWIRPPGVSGWFATWFPGHARALLPDGRSWYDGQTGIGTLFWQTSGFGGWGDYVADSGAFTNPLDPTIAYGTCTTGTPTLISDPQAPGGVRGICAP